MDCVDYTSGSLGQGLSAANGMALAAKFLNYDEVRFFTLIGDGELQEGQVWEAIMTAGSKKLNNIVAIIDKNNFQQDGSLSEIKNIDPIDEKIKSFGWDVETTNGHSFQDLSECLGNKNEDKPLMIIAETIKGKGISFMEGNNDWHVGS